MLSFIDKSIDKGLAT